MADIELVIKIPEEQKKMVDAMMELPPQVENDLISAIRHGTSLPKGHGRLIDADAFIEQESCCGYIEDMDIDYFKQNTPTIIEADKE